MAALSKHAPVAERLRAFVRDRVRREGRLYERGVGAALAKHLQKPSSWVSEYTDPNPPPGKFRTADLDTAAAMCEFFQVTLNDFAKGQPATATLRAVRPAKYVRRAVRLLELMSEKGQREVVDLLATLVRAYPLDAPQELPARSAQSREATGRTAHGKR